MTFLPLASTFSSKRSMIPDIVCIHLLNLCVVLRLTLHVCRQGILTYKKTRQPTQKVKKTLCLLPASWCRLTKRARTVLPNSRIGAECILSRIKRERFYPPRWYLIRAHSLSWEPVNPGRQDVGLEVKSFNGRLKARVWAHDCLAKEMSRPKQNLKNL